MATTCYTGYNYYEIMQKFNSKITSLLILLAVFTSLSPIFATNTNAQLFVPTFPVDAKSNIVNGTVQTKKEWIVDTFAWAAVNIIIERLAASTVKWINSGFKGKPAFVTNPDKYFKDIGDKLAGQAIFNNPKLNFLCGPLRAKVRLALTQSYLQDRQWQCTLTQVGRNFEDFMDDFNNGGWDNFFELTQRQQNNPIGAFLQAEVELNSQLANQQKKVNDELDRGKGFLSYKTCKRWKDVPFQNSGNPDKSITDYYSEVQGGNEDFADPNACLPGQTMGEGGCYGDADPNFAQDWTFVYDAGQENPPGKVCAESETVTPGSVISDQLNNVLNIGNDKLAVADEFNEIISALLNQMVAQVVGGIGKGLKGLSDKDPGNGNRIFTDEVLKRGPGSQIKDYFGDVQNTDMINIPDDLHCIDNPYTADCQPPPPPVDPSTAGGSSSVGGLVNSPGNAGNVGGGNSGGRAQ